MALTDRDRVLYARHLLLAEIGEAGQERLGQSVVRLSGADETTRAVCADALSRAGVSLSDAPSARHIDLGDVDALDALAGRPELREAASALQGAFVAVEAIKAIVGTGTPADLSGQLTLTSEDA